MVTGKLIVLYEGVKGEGKLFEDLAGINNFLCGFVPDIVGHVLVCFYHKLKVCRSLAGHTLKTFGRRQAIISKIHLKDLKTQRLFVEFEPIVFL